MMPCLHFSFLVSSRVANCCNCGLYMIIQFSKHVKGNDDTEDEDEDEEDDDEDEDALDKQLRNRIS
jgi:hypothetical protein